MNRNRLDRPARPTISTGNPPPHSYPIDRLNEIYLETKLWQIRAMRFLFRLENLIAIVAGILILSSSSSFTALGATTAAAPTAEEVAGNEATKNSDPLISKWPEFVAWYRSHGGMGKSY